MKESSSSFSDEYSGSGLAESKDKALQWRIGVLVVALLVYAFDLFSLVYLLTSFSSARGFACCSLCRARQWVDANVDPQSIAQANGTMCALAASAKGFGSLFARCAPVVPPPSCGPYSCDPNRLNEAYAAAKDSGFSFAVFRLVVLLAAASIAVVTTWKMPRRRRNRRLLRLAILGLLVLSVVLAIVLFVLKAGYADVDCDDAFSGTGNSLCQRDQATCPGLKIVAVFTNPDVFALPAIISIVTALVSVVLFIFKVVFRKRLRHKPSQEAEERATLAGNLDEIDAAADETELDAAATPVVCPAAVVVAVAPSVSPTEPDIPLGMCCVASSMPPGWERSITVGDNGKRVFFYSDHAHAATSWDPPPGSAILPPGVEEKFDATGRPFYLNHNTATTSWDPPL